MPDAGDFMFGFVFNHKPSSSEVSHFVLPLYQRTVALHLSHATPLTGADTYVKVREQSFRDSAAEFVQKTRAYEQIVRERANLNAFHSELKHGRALSNPRIRYPYALTLTMLGRFDEAAPHLRTVATDDWVRRVVPHEAEDAQRLLGAAESNQEDASSMLQKWKRENLKRYGVVSQSAVSELQR